MTACIMSPGAIIRNSTVVALSGDQFSAFCKYLKRYGYTARVPRVSSNPTEVLTIDARGNLIWSAATDITHAREVTLAEIEHVIAPIGHKFADLIQQYANDAAETDTPWVRWEFRHIASTEFIQCTNHPLWDENNEYRRKQPVLTIGNSTIAAPLKTAPANGTWVHIVDLGCEYLYNSCSWMPCDRNLRYLRRGLVHLSPEAALQHAQALLNITNTSYL